MIAVPIVTSIIGIGQTYLTNVVGLNVMQDLRNRLYQHLQAMPLRFFTTTRTGEIQSRLANDVGGRPIRGHRHRVDGALERRHDHQHDHRDAPDLAPAHDPVPAAASVVPLAHRQGRQGPAGGRDQHPADPRGHDHDHRGDAQRERDPAVEGLRSSAVRERSVPGRERAPDRLPAPPDDDRPVVLRARGHVLLDHARPRLPRGRLGQLERRIGRDRGGDARRVHDPAVAAVLPDRLDAAGLDRGAVLARALRSDLRVPGPAARDPGRAGCREDPRREWPRAAPRRALPVRGPTSRGAGRHPGLARRLTAG